jgi:alkyl hydroperoxide reductase subunit AhpF
MVKAIDIVSLDDKTNKEEIKLDGVFVEIGHESKSDWLKGLVDLNKRGEVISDCNGQTSVPGLFTAGDCSDSRYKQIVIAAGAGAKSALQVYKYVAAKGGGAITSDWGKCELVGTDDTVKIKLEK